MPNSLQGRLREALRTRFFDLLRRTAATDDARQIFSGMLRSEIGISIPSGLVNAAQEAPPYDDLGKQSTAADAAQRDAHPPIFVTGRFRSGSTLFWNLFRHLPDTTAYYEPFNERRWFDPLTRGSNVDATHLNVDDYWAEYDGLTSLAQHYRLEWIDKQLYMSDRAWDPGMQRYIEELIAHAKGRAVLQFNRVDLRLPWLRSTFPRAKILHVFRHPRDQWCSTLRGFTGDMQRLTLDTFEAHDGFYLLSWGRDLRHYFPFMQVSGAAHPYELFYQIWKLSYLFGRTYSDVSLAYEEVLAAPRERIDRIMRDLGIQQYDADSLASLVTPMETGKWKQWNCAAFFEEIEKRADATISAFIIAQRA